MVAQTIRCNISLYRVVVVSFRNPVCLALALMACHRGAPAPVASEVAITLDGEWSSKPWVAEPRGAPNGLPVQLSTTFAVSAELAGQPVDIVLEGLWWNAQLWLDKERVGTVVGGRPPVRARLSDGLTEGEHSLLLVIQPARGVSRFAHGGGLGSTTPTTRATLHNPPVLQFGPSSVKTAGVRVKGPKATAFARFDTARVPEGTEVRFQTVLDGRVQTEFGVVKVDASGNATSPGTPPRGPLWEWGKPSLSHLMVEVLAADGTARERHSVRTGLRETVMTPSGLQVNDTKGPAVAVRVLHGLSEPDLLAVFSDAAPAGVNAVEIHGDMVDSRQLSLADELGIPLVVLPRCVGRVGRPPGGGVSLVETLRDQDRRMVAGVGAHPSVVSWLVEGDRQILGPGRKDDDGEVDPWTDVIPADPMRRSVVGVDIPGTLLQVRDLRTGDYTCPAGCAGKWIVESTFRIVPTPNLWSAVARAWGKAASEGIPGGTLPTPRAAENDAWVRAFTPVLKEMGAPSFPLAQRKRANSRLRVTGAAPGELIWIEAPGATLVGAQAGSDGVATVDIWYDGDATVHGQGWSQEVDLDAMHWQGVKLYGEVAEVAVPSTRSAR